MSARRPHSMMTHAHYDRLCRRAVRSFGLYLVQPRSELELSDAYMAFSQLYAHCQQYSQPDTRFFSRRQHVGQQMHSTNNIHCHTYWPMGTHGRFDSRIFESAHHFRIDSNRAADSNSNRISKLRSSLMFMDHTILKMQLTSGTANTAIFVGIL